ncbi:MAG: hypothetical protein IIC52_12015 [Proteobacteria bacterium]|nr:hypothetical protein [Pseudomonadota bacterium]
MAHWSPQDIPWESFDPARVDADIVKLVKAAAMVEKNSADYATYLCNVFAGDAAFQKAARHWAREEVQHGDVLGRWAEMADPERIEKVKAERMRNFLDDVAEGLYDQNAKN